MGRVCEFHQRHPDQDATMNSCEDCVYIEEPCGCLDGESCDKCGLLTREEAIKDVEVQQGIATLLQRNEGAYGLDIECAKAECVQEKVCEGLVEGLALDLSGMSEGRWKERAPEEEKDKWRKEARATIQSARKSEDSAEDKTIKAVGSKSAIVETADTKCGLNFGASAPLKDEPSKCCRQSLSCGGPMLGILDGGKSICANCGDKVQKPSKEEIKMVKVSNKVSDDDYKEHEKNCDFCKGINEYIGNKEPATEEEKLLLFGFEEEITYEGKITRLRNHVRTHAPAALLKDKEAVDTTAEWLCYDHLMTLWGTTKMVKQKWGSLDEIEKEPYRDLARALFRKLGERRD